MLNTRGVRQRLVPPRHLLESSEPEVSVGRECRGALSMVWYRARGRQLRGLLQGKLALLGGLHHRASQQGFANTAHASTRDESCAGSVTPASQRREGCVKFQPLAPAHQSFSFPRQKLVRCEEDGHEGGVGISSACRGGSCRPPSLPPPPLLTPARPTARRSAVTSTSSRQQQQWRGLFSSPSTWAARRRTTAPRSPPCTAPAASSRRPSGRTSAAPAGCSPR